MTPDQIKPGHTYELKSGTRWTVKSFIENGRSIIITDGEVTAYDTPHDFARYAVRDVTPAPESDQGEKVAQAQSQGASRGDGDGLVRKFAIDVAEYLYDAGHRDDGPEGSSGTRLLRQAREIVQEPPYAAAVNAELLAVVRRFVAEWDATWVDPNDINHDWAELYSQARAAIALAEAGTPSHPRFRHKRTGDIYELLLIANEHAERAAQYPPTAVYRRVSDLTVWSRPVQDWGKDFEEVTGNE